MLPFRKHKLIGRQKPKVRQVRQYLLINVDRDVSVLRISNSSINRLI